MMNDRDVNPHYPDMPDVQDVHRAEFHYLRALNILNKARGNGEPVFVLRARDMHSVVALREYMDALDVHTPPDEDPSPEYDSMVNLLANFIEWQKQHGTKHPDL